MTDPPLEGKEKWKRAHTYPLVQSNSLNFIVHLLLAVLGVSASVSLALELGRRGEGLRLFLHLQDTDEEGEGHCRHSPDASREVRKGDKVGPHNTWPPWLWLRVGRERRRNTQATVDTPARVRP